LTSPAVAATIESIHTRCRAVIRPTLIALLFALSSACSAPSAAPSPDMTLDFQALWTVERTGTEADTRGIALSVWNTSRDQPHPEIVNARIQIAVPAEARRRPALLTLREEWQTGTRAGDGASWSEPSQRTAPPLDLVPGKTVRLSLPLAVGDMVRQQTRTGRAPWRLAVRAELRDAASAATLATAQATLPIVAMP
jgi:hypothetical protein